MPELVHSAQRHSDSASDTAATATQNQRYSDTISVSPSVQRRHDSVHRGGGVREPTAQSARQTRRPHHWHPWCCPLGRYASVLLPAGHTYSSGHIATHLVKPGATAITTTARGPSHQRRVPADSSVSTHRVFRQPPDGHLASATGSAWSDKACRQREQRHAGLRVRGGHDHAPRVVRARVRSRSSPRANTVAKPASASSRTETR